ncbi:MAG: AsmA family protein [Planctomycetota bacterium]
MKKGKKIITVIVIVLLAVIVIAAVLFTLLGDKLIRAAVETGGTKTLQVGVRLEDVSLSLLKGKVELTNLEIDNPQGYDNSSFMTVGYGHLDLNTGSLMSDTVEMDKIQFDDIKLVIEQKEADNNLKQILDNLPKSDSTDPDPQEEPAAEGAGKNFRIKVLEINNVEVTAKLALVQGQADEIQFKIKPIRLENIGTDEKVDTAALAAIVLEAIAQGVAEEGEGLLPEDITDSVSEELDRLLGENEEATGVLKGLGDLLKKKDEKKD